MPIRKHTRKQNFNRPPPWPNPPKQYVATLDVYAKLLGIKTHIEAIVAQIEEANIRFLQKYKVATEPREKTALDVLRLKRAADRRALLNGKRAVSYARCIHGNWNKTLTENLYKATVNISRTLEVDKAFVKKFA